VDIFKITLGLKSWLSFWRYQNVWRSFYFKSEIGKNRKSGYLHIQTNKARERAKQTKEENTQRHEQRRT